MIPLWSPEVEASVRAEARSLDEQARPTEVKFCKRCVVSNQRPRIVFDAEGICSACRFAERKRNGIDWGGRAAELIRLLDRHRGRGGYDVVVPVSGGKDSATVAHRLKYQHKMNPLCVKWAPFIYTDIGRQNFESFVQSGFDVLVGWPNGLLHRRLARLCFEFLGDPFQPFAFGQLAFPMQIAAKFKIPLVFYGENGEAEYGGDPAANDRPCWDIIDWERVYLKGTGVGRIIGWGLELGVFTIDEAKSISEFYSLPSREQLGGTEFHWFSYYRRWHPQENFYYATEHTGFTTNDGHSEGTYSKYASLDDKLDCFHYYMAYIKFGIGRATSDAAHEIRDGEITRDEAVALVKRYDDEFPTRHLAECLDYLGLDLDQYRRIEDRFRPAHLWEKTDDLWRLKHAVWHGVERDHLDGAGALVSA